MTEQEWLECTEPQVMLEFLKGKVTDRKLRLFACACCRQIYDLLSKKRITEKTVTFAERFADGRATETQLHGNSWGEPGEFRGVVLWDAWNAAETSAEHASGLVEKSVRTENPLACQIWERTFEIAWSQHDLGEARRIADEGSPAEWVKQGKSARRTEQRKQGWILRDIFCNPYRPITLDPRWLTSTVVELAQAIYNEKAFERMPILADALMDAGCDNDEMIAHCRSDGPHVRGCWAVDLLLSKE